MSWNAAAEGPVRASEQAVKAAYLHKLAPFIEWPAAAFGPPDEPITLCVVGADPVSALVDDAGGSVPRSGERGVRVRHLSANDSEAGCHILYIGTPGAAAVALLDRARGKSILTVTDAAPPGSRRGIVNFVVRDNRVRFEIDTDAAAQSRLAISSKLLNLAVRDGAP